jgi:transposase
MSVSPVEVATTAFVGIDVAQVKLDVVVRLDASRTYRVLANQPEGFAALHHWLSSLPVAQCRLCLEATGSYSDALVSFLHAHNYYISVLPPATLVSFRRSEGVRSKTDALDADLLARYARQKQPRRWVPLPQEVQTLRLLLAYRQDVLGMLVQQRNRLHAGRLTAWTRQQVERQGEQFRQALRGAEQQIKAHLKAAKTLTPLWRRLQTIPGIGWLTAAHLIAHIGDVARFPRVGALVSLAGLAVQQHESGSSVHRPAHIDRHGRADLRQQLYWCAVTAMRVDAQIAAWSQRLLARGKARPVVIVAVMRKLLHLVYGVWRSESDYDPAKVLGPVPAR